MVLSDLLATLRSEGFHVTASTVAYAILTQRVSPPPLDGAGNRRFGEKHLAELREYLSRPRRRGRRPRSDRQVAAEGAA